MCKLYRQALAARGTTYVRCVKCASLIADMKVHGYKGLNALLRLQRDIKRLLPGPRELTLRREDLAEDEEGA